MSTVIDHAISIPAPQEQVWEQVRDIELNPRWQANSDHITFLTTKHNGRGARWRSTTPGGKEQVIEITAWYEGLGYEYVIVDGVSYENNRGRIRIQEVPEGTVVQWTFSYDVSGMFGGLLNTISTKRRLDGDIVDSLRNLYRHVKSVRSGDYTPEQSRALMKAAPDVEERSKYRPRHPSVIRPGEKDETVDEVTTQETGNDPDAMFKPPAEATPQPALDDASSTEQDSVSAEVPAAEPGIPIIEPPLSDDDTRPNPTVQDTATLDETTTEETAADTNVADIVKQASVRDRQEHPAAPEDDAQPVASDTKAEAAATVGETSADDETLSHRDDTVSRADTDTTDSEPEITEVAPPQPPQPQPDLNKLDTSQVSVFDLFGVPRPGEMESAEDTPATDPDAAPSDPVIASNPAAEQERITEAKTADAGEEASPFDDAPIVPDIEPEPERGRTGLRAKLRRRLTNLRRP
jgi:uncharacterized membrane protein